MNYNDMGLLRFSIIAPAINNTHSFPSNESFFVDAANKEYNLNGKKLTFTKSCIKNWYIQYQKNGFYALQSHSRKDISSSRKLSKETIERILVLRKEFPNMTGTALYKKLIEEKYFLKDEISLSTILRYLKSNNLKSSQVSIVERRMFEMENVNDCWQSDTSDGPYITIDNVKYRAKLIMFIDDKSRLITGYDFFFNDTAINMQKVFKKAIKKYGKPKKLFVDNGGPYANKQLSLICASLGIELIHAKPYSPESKAKIERSFRTIKDGWMRCTNWNDFKSLDDARESLDKFIYNNYINKVHSSTGQSPNIRWHNEFSKVKMLDNGFIDECFLHRIERKVRKDRTIKIENIFYEVPYKYVNQTIEVRYNPETFEEVYIYQNNDRKEICKKVDKVANSKVKRKNNIDYSLAINNELNVQERS